ncbi:hypothetical protein, partial [Serratia bockelmannii]|uniref:hypothetical protein n=1 Tax=Serratia bockelmannii TaxID=2703793 RepID=UPI003FA7AFE2
FIMKSNKNQFKINKLKETFASCTLPPLASSYQSLIRTLICHHYCSLLHLAFHKHRAASDEK